MVTEQVTAASGAAGAGAAVEEAQSLRETVAEWQRAGTPRVEEADLVVFPPVVVVVVVRVAVAGVGCGEARGIPTPLPTPAGGRCI